MALVGAQLLRGALEIDAIRRLVQSELSGALGLPVQIAGEFRLDLLPRPHLEATRITVEGPPGREATQLLELGTLELVLALWPLITGQVEIEVVRLHDGTLRLEEDEHGALGLAPEAGALEGGPPNDPLELREIELVNLLIFYRRAGEPADWTLQLDKLRLTAPGAGAAVVLVASGEMEGNSFEFDSQLGSLVQLLRPSQPFPFELTLETEEGELRARGSVQDPRTLRGVDIAVDAEIQDLAGLSDRDAPPIGPVSLHARISDAGGSLGAHDVVLRALDGAPFRGGVTGTIADLREFSGVALAVELSSDDTSFLGDLPLTPFDAIDTLNVSARLSDADQTLGVEGTLRASADQDRIKIEIEGIHDDLSRLHQLEARVSASALDLEVLGRALELDIALPPIGPVEVRGVLVGRDGELGARDVEIDLGSLPELAIRARGAVRDLSGPSGVAFDVDLEAHDLQALGRRFGRELPKLGSLRGTAQVEDKDGSIGAERFEVSGGGTRGLLSFKASGSFDDVREIEDLEMDVRVDARDLGVIGQLLGRELPPIGPVEARGSARGSHDHLDSRGTLRLDKTRISGRWTVKFPDGGQPRLHGRLSSKHLFLDDVGVYPREGERERGPGMSLDSELPLAPLRDFDLDIELAAQRVSGHGDLEGRDALIDIDLVGGRLAARLRGEYESGAMELAVEVDAHGDDPRHTLKLSAQNVDMTRLAAQVQQDTDFAGLANADVSLSARGSTPRELLASLGGQFRVTARQGALVSRYARAFVMDFARISLPTLGTPSKQKVNCAALFASLERGVASLDLLLLDAPRVHVSGSGQIDLAGDRYDLLLQPRARDPGLVSVASDVQVTGSLSNPRIRPVPRSMATSAARALVSNARRPADFVLRSLRRGDAPQLEDGCPVLFEAP